MLSLILSTAIAMSTPQSPVCQPTGGAFQPYRQNSAAEECILLAERMAQQNKWNEAIINYRKASELASNECERGFATTGEKAAIAARDVFKKMGGMKNRFSGQASFAKFRQVGDELQQTEMPNTCFV